MMDKKRILFIQHSLAGGGAEKVLIDLLDNFDYSKYKVTLLVIERGIDRYLNQVNSQVVCRVVYPNGKPLYKRILSKFHRNTAFMRKEMDSILKDERFDAIISWMEGPSVAYHRFLLNRTSNNISWVHSDLLENSWDAPFFRNQEEENCIYQQMNHIAFVSPKALEAFNKRFKVEHEREIVRLNAIDKDRILRESTLSLQSNESQIFTICSVGRLTPVKNYDRLIDACAILKNKGLHFKVQILGDGVLRTSLQQKIDELELSNYIKLLGFQSNPYPYIRSSSVFVLCSDVEGYPTVVCEAMTLGVPCITTRVTGSIDVMTKDGMEYGVLCDTNADSLAQAIEMIMNNESLLDFYRNKSLERAKDFSIEKSLSEVYELIEVPL